MHSPSHEPTPTPGGKSAPDWLVISTREDLLQFDVIHRFIASTYWAEAMPKNLLRRAIKNSLNVGAYDGRPNTGNTQVGYARIISDRATFAYLCDVFVLETHQNQGIATAMMHAILALPELQPIRRFMLFTRDAHPLYARFGFRPCQTPEAMMEITRPGLYRRWRDEAENAGIPHPFQD